MTVADLIQALGLPEPTRVNQRVPKKLLGEHGAATAGDKRQIQEGVDEITWLAALKPHVIGVPAFQDAQRQYPELAVLCMALKPSASDGTKPRSKPDRLAELVHRAVPYPVLLIITSDEGLSVSLAHLRGSQNDADKTVLDGEMLSVIVPTIAHDDGDAHVLDKAFRAALALAHQPQSDLYALYQGWMDTVDALNIARETGAFQPSLSRKQATVRHAALLQCRQLRDSMAQLRTLAEKERQLARQVALNHEIRTGQAQLQNLQRLLKGEAA